jgi:predicted Zn finger-like uncharacterized protein
MLVICNQCQARYKITIAKNSGKAVAFKCGKCQNLIRLSPERIAAESKEPAPAPKVLPRKIPAAPAADTIKQKCLRCGNPFVKPASDQSPLCYQCRIDSLVDKIRDKYGVTPAVPAPAAAAPAPATAPAPAAAAPAPAPTPAGAVSRYAVRSSDGLILGPIKLRTVAVLAREKRILGREEVSRDDSEFQPLMSYPELAELFPDLKVILDTDGLEDKVDEAFMAVFGADEGRSETAAPVAAADAEPVVVAAESFALEERAATTAVLEVPPEEEGTEFDLGNEGGEAAASEEAEEEIIENLEPLPEPPADARYRIRYPDGLILGPVKVGTVRELFQSGHLTGQEEVQREDDPWVGFADLPELAALVSEAEVIHEDEVLELTDLLEEKK